MTFRLLTLQDLRNQPPLRWLIHKYLPLNAQALLFGPPGAGKSFDAVDLAMSVASGEPWLGRFKVTTPGPVVYIAGEGVDGMALRAQAWLDKRGVIEPANIYFIPGPVAFLDDGQAEGLIADISALPAPPVLIVVDTLARCLVGGDENSSKEVGLYVAAGGRLKDAFGATVLTLHHSGWNGGHERGSTALGGAMDTRIALIGGVEPDRLHHTLLCNKQKDGAAPFKPIHVRLVPTGAEDDDNTTCTVEAVDSDSGGAGQARQCKRDKDAETFQADIRRIVSLLLTGPMRGPQLCEAAGVSKSTFDKRRLPELRDDMGYIISTPDGYALTPAGRMWAADEELKPSKDASVAPLHSTTHSVTLPEASWGGSVAVSVSHPPLGVTQHDTHPCPENTGTQAAAAISDYDIVEAAIAAASEGQAEGQAVLDGTFPPAPQSHSAGTGPVQHVASLRAERLRRQRRSSTA